MKKITIIIPAFNEEKCIVDFYNAVEPYINKEGIESRYLFIDDGSKDETLNIIKELRQKDNRVNFISFSRNSGKEAALLAGLKACKDQDAVIMMDSDLQHPPYLIEEMLNKLDEGYNIVYTRQKTRKGDSFIKRSFAKMFYSIFNKHSEVSLEQSSKDYMLIDNKVINAFLSMPDSYRFTRGIFSYVGFKKYCLEFEFVQREKGKSKWNFVKLLKYGVSGLNQFSTFFLSVPVIASIMCFLVMIASLVLYLTHVFDLSSFLILLLVPFLLICTNVVLYFMLLVLYSTRREAMKRPTYFIMESSLDEETL